MKKHSLAKFALERFNETIEAENSVSESKNDQGYVYEQSGEAKNR